MACSVTDIACGIQSVFLPLLIPAVLLIIIVVVGLLVPGRKIKGVALLAFLVWAAYYVGPLFGFSQFHDFLHGLIGGAV